MTAPRYYQSSKGPRLIAEMPRPHLENAAAKLIREGGDADLIAALQAEMAERDAAWAELQAAAHGAA